MWISGTAFIVSTFCIVIQQDGTGRYIAECAVVTSAQEQGDLIKLLADWHIL